MAMEITSGLFGKAAPTFTQEFTGAMGAFKGATPTDIAAGLSYAGASQLGKGLMQGFGVEDPDQADANMVKKISAMLQQQGISTQTPEGMVKLAEVLNSQGRADLAEKAIGYANVLKKAATEEQYKQAQIRTQGAQADLYGKQAEVAGRKTQLKQDAQGNVSVYEDGNLIRVDTAPMLKAAGMGGGNAPAAPGQPGKVAPKGRPPLTDPSLQR
jgi:hypothetical protein